VPPQTEVFYNGVSIGIYSTAQLSSRYSNLFTFLKGPVGNIQVYGPKGSLPDLGASRPSGVTIGKATPSAKVAEAHPKPAPHVQVHAKAVPTHKPVVHKAVAHKNQSSFFSLLFPFKF
jgi:hypothetical protein